MVSLRMVRRSWSVGKRSYSILASSVAASRFFNREAELLSLDEILRPSEYGAPGKLMAILGPKDSGKTALIREFRRKQEEKGGLAGVSAYIDLREKSNQNPDEFARTLWKSLGASLSEKIEAGVDLKVLGKWALSLSDYSFKLSTPVGSFSFEEQQNALAMVFRALEEYCLNMSGVLLSGYVGGFPTIFIDEANVLRSWDSKLATELMRQLVRISKQECVANVVLLSSENFFKTWLEGSPAIKGHDLITKTIGNFPKEEAKAFVSLRVGERMNEVEEIWDDVFEHIGGGPLQLWSFSSVVKKAEPGLVRQAWEDWKREKVFSALATLKANGFRPIAYEGSSAKMWTSKDFVEVVKKLVKKPDGAVPYYSLLELGNVVDSMIEHHLLQYRTYGWDRDLSGVAAKDYPIVMPANRLQFVAMKELLEDVQE